MQSARSSDGIRVMDPFRRRGVEAGRAYPLKPAIGAPYPNQRASAGCPGRAVRRRGQREGLPVVESAAFDVGGELLRELREVVAVGYFVYS